MIRRLTKDEDHNKVAQLIYETDSTIFPLLFGKNKDQAFNKIRQLIKLEDNYFSYQNIIIFEEKGDTYGMCIYFQSDSQTKKRLEKNLFKPFNIIELIRVFIKAFPLMISLESKGSIDTLYIQNLCVNRAMQGKGVGSQLIKYVIDEAQKTNHQFVSLDVSLDNPGAKKLYTKHKFKTKQTKRVPFTKHGVNHMIHNIKLTT